MGAAEMMMDKVKTFGAKTDKTVERKVWNIRTSFFLSFKQPAILAARGCGIYVRQDFEERPSFSPLKEPLVI